MAKKVGPPTKSEVLATIAAQTGLTRKQVAGVLESLNGMPVFMPPARSPLILSRTDGEVWLDGGDFAFGSFPLTEALSPEPGYSRGLRPCT